MKIVRQTLIFLVLLSAAAWSRNVSYTLKIEKPHRHNFSIEIRYPLSGEAQVSFVMPAWAPGYYAIRNLAKNVYHVKAADEQGRELPFRKTDKETWQVETAGAQQVTLSYQVYAYSHGDPYSAHLGPGFAYYNGAYLFMYVEGEKNSPADIRFQYPADWDFHTALPEKIGENHYRAPDYDVFIDSPAFFGRLSKFSFEVLGKPHHVVLNAGYAYNREQMTTDLTRLVKWFAGMFGDLPYQEYTFFVRVADPGHGGIEHLNANVSCVIPAALSGDLNDPNYFGHFLMLESHEFFHAYNVKRIRPAGLGPFDYTREVYTRLLWFSEGFTSYYTHRPLVTAGILERQKIYPSWAGYYQDLYENAALYIKPVSQYSFDSWIAESDIPDYTFRVFYRKGAYIAMLLDIDMRRRSGHQKSMDGFFRFLYQEVYKAGKTFNLPEFLALLNRYSGNDYGEFFRKYVTGTEPLPIQETLAEIGLDLHAAEESPFLGIEPQPESEGPVKVYYVYPGSPADALALSRGDEIVSLNSRWVNTGNWDAAIEELPLNRPVSVSWFRDGRLRQGTAILTSLRARDFAVSELPVLTKAQRQFLQEWFKSE